MEGLFRWQIAKLIIWLKRREMPTQRRKDLPKKSLSQHFNGIYKQNITCPPLDTNFYRLWIRIFIFSCSNRYLTRSLRSGTREISTWTLEDKIRIYMRTCHILYLSIVDNLILLLAIKHIQTPSKPSTNDTNHSCFQIHGNSTTFIQIIHSAIKIYTIWLL